MASEVCLCKSRFKNTITHPNPDCPIHGSARPLPKESAPGVNPADERLIDTVLDWLERHRKHTHEVSRYSAQLIIQSVRNFDMRQRETSPVSEIDG